MAERPHHFVEAIGFDGMDFLSAGRAARLMQNYRGLTANAEWYNVLSCQFPLSFAAVYTAANDCRSCHGR